MKYGYVLLVALFLHAVASGQSANVLPESVNDVRIGAPAAAVTARPGIRENTLLTAKGREKSYVELLSQSPFFSEAVYGVSGDTVSFVYLVGPPAAPRTSLALYVKGLVDGAMRKYGTSYHAQIVSRRLPQFTFDEMLFMWSVDGVTVGIAVPSKATQEMAATKNASAGTVARVRFIAFDPRSVIAPPLFGFEPRETTAKEKSEVDRFLQWLATVPGDAPAFK